MNLPIVVGNLSFPLGGGNYLHEEILALFDAAARRGGDKSPAAEGAGDDDVSVLAAPFFCKGDNFFNHIFIDGQPGNLDASQQLLGTLLLLVAASYGCTPLCREMVVAATRSDGQFAERHTKFLCKAVYPYQPPTDDNQGLVNFLSAAEADWGKLIAEVDCSLVGTDESQVEGISHDNRESATRLVGGGVGVPHLHEQPSHPSNFFGHISSTVPLPHLILFVARTATLDATGKVILPSLLSSPMTNHRLLSFYRISGRYVDPDQTTTPLLDVLTGSGLPPPLNNVSIAVFPYSVSGMALGDHPPDSILSPWYTDCFNNQPAPNNVVCASCPIPGDLDNILAAVCGTTSLAVAAMPEPHPPDNSSYNFVVERVCQQMLYLFAILRDRYDNLCTTTGWVRLFKALAANVFDTAPEDGPPEYFQPTSFRDLVSKTLLLFQSLTPLRLAFVDGQARVAAVMHCLLGVHPFSGLGCEGDNIPVCFSTTGTNLPPHTSQGYDPSKQFWQSMEKVVPVQILVAAHSMVSGTTTAAASLVVQGDKVGGRSAYHHQPVTAETMHMLRLYSCDLQTSVDLATRKSVHDAIIACLQKCVTKPPMVPESGRKDCLEANKNRRLWFFRSLLSYLCDSTNLWRSHLSAKRNLLSATQGDVLTVESFEDAYQKEMTSGFPNIKSIRLPHPPDFFATLAFLTHCTSDQSSLDAVQHCLVDQFTGSLNTKHGLSSLLLPHTIEAESENSGEVIIDQSDSFCKETVHDPRGVKKIKVTFPT